MKQFQENIESITFKNSMMIKCHDKDKTLWGSFSKPSNYGKFEWFHTKEGEHFVSIPMHVKGNWQRIQSLCLPFEQCLELCNEYDIFCDNSEQF